MGNVMVNPYVFSSSGGGSWSAWNGSADGSNQDSGVTSGNTGVIALSSSTFISVNINGTAINALVGTISGTSVSYGSPTNLNPGAGFFPQNMSISLLSTNKVIIVFQNSSNGDGYAVVATISGTTITGGAIQQFASPGGGNSTVIHNQQVAAISSSLAFVAYHDYNGSDLISGVTLSVSGTTITVNTPASIATSTAGSAPPSVVYYNTNKVLVVYNKATKITARIVNISGTSVGTLGAETQVDATTLSDSKINAAIVSATAVIVTYSISGNLKGAALSLSSNTVTANTPAVITSTSGILSKWIEPLNSTEYMAIYNTGVSTELAKVVTLTGTVLTSGSEVAIQPSGTTAGQQISKLDDSTVVNGVIISSKGQAKILKRA